MKTTSVIVAFISILAVAAPSIDAQPYAADPSPSLVTRLDTPDVPPAAAAPAARPADLLADVEKMLQSGADESVIKSFIQTWSRPYSLNADQILHLHDIGASTDILTTLIHHSAELLARTPAAPSPNATPGGGYPPMSLTNSPAYIYPYPSAPAATYSYLYPEYSYPLLPSYSYYWGSPFFYSYWSWPGYRYRYGYGYGYRPWYGYRAGGPAYYGGWRSSPGYYGGHSGFYNHGGFSRGGGFGHGHR